MSSWLQSGGSVVVMSLQYPTHEFVKTSIKNITGIDLNNYSQNVIFIQLDTEICGYEIVNSQLINANLVKPDIWDESINMAIKHLPDNGPGILIFASALNLLLFSPSYGNAIFSKIKETIKTNTRLTYIISVSTSAKKEQIKQLETMADNLILSRSDKSPFRLYMTIKRLTDGHFNNSEIQIPVTENTLKSIKEMANHSKGKVLPAIMKI